MVQQGTRRYRLCNECLAEAGMDNIPNDDTDSEHPLLISIRNKNSRWPLEEEHRSDVEILKDESDKLVDQQVNNDSADEAEEKVKSNIR